jgi:hypothetical protein
MRPEAANAPETSTFTKANETALCLKIFGSIFGAVQGKGKCRKKNSNYKNYMMGEIWLNI